MTQTTNDPLARDWGQFIDGEMTHGSGDALVVDNPYSEKAVGEIARSTLADVDRAVAAARRAQDEGPWRTMSRRDRSLLLSRMADALDARRADLQDIHVAETGMFRMMNDGFGIGQPLEWWRGYAELAGRDWDEGIRPAVMNAGLGDKLTGALVTQEPAGVVSAIVPFNFPFFVATHKVAAALAAGCSVVLKLSELTPLTCTLIAEAALEAELPPGAFNYVVGEAEVGARLVEHPDVDVVSFTGSTTVGKAIATSAAQTVKKVVLELGGKSAAIVLDDADLDACVPVLLGQFSHGGQGCALSTRLVVHESIADELVARLTTLIPFLTPGDPAEPGTTHSPQITAAARQRVLGYIDAGLAQGAELIAGGGPITSQPTGHWVEPTLFDRCPVDASIAQEEIFGPVLVVHRFTTEAEAVAIANHSIYGLWGTVFTKDLPRGMAVARQIRTGSVGINGMALNFHAPFGGVKQSGVGREFGEYGVREFFEPKSISWMS
jgi:aldehyde dehydrogenase (NAD+)